MGNYIEEVVIHKMPEYISAPTRNMMRTPVYSVAEDGASSHPIRGVEEVYQRTVVFTYEISGDVIHKVSHDYNTIIESLMRHEEVQWAFENAFDNPKVEKTYLAYNDTTRFRIVAYLKPEHATFFKLKFA